MERDSTKSGISPVVGVILIIAITVLLSATIGVFVLDMADLNRGSVTSAGVRVSSTTDGGADALAVQVVSAESTVSYRVNGGPLTSLGEAGAQATLIAGADYEPGDTIAFIQNGRVVQSTKTSTDGSISLVTDGTDTPESETPSSTPTPTLTPAPVSGEPARFDPSTDDSFETYSTTDDSEGSATLVSSPSVDGQALELLTPSQCDSVTVESTDGFTEPFSAGDTMSLDLRLSNPEHASPSMIIGDQNGGDAIQVSQSWDEKFIVKEYTNGQSDILLRTGTTKQSSNEWVTWTIEWDETTNDITVTIGEEQAYTTRTTLSSVDAGFSIGFYNDCGGGSDETMHVDSVTLSR